MSIKEKENPCQQWLDKTVWIQDDMIAGKLPDEYWGLHRADAIKSEIDRLREENKVLQDRLAWSQRACDMYAGNGLTEQLASDVKWALSQVGVQDHLVNYGKVSEVKVKFDNYIQSVFPGEKQNDSE